MTFMVEKTLVLDDENKAKVFGAVLGLNESIIHSVALPSRGEQMQIKLWHAQWSVIMAWVLRGQGVIDDKDKAVLMKTADVKCLRPAGDVFNSLLNLCRAIRLQLDDHIDDESEAEIFDLLPHENAIEHWQLLVAEAKMTSFLKLGEKRSKREMEDELERTIKALKDCFGTGANPYNPQETPHHYELIEISKMIGKPREGDKFNIKRARKRFRDGSFNDFVLALYNWKRALRKSSWKAVYTNRDSLMAIKGARKVSPVIFDDPPSICAQTL